MKCWLDVCAKGPAPISASGPAREWYRKGSAAREQIAECERLGSLANLGDFPRDVAIYNPQTDRRHPASDHVVGLAGLDVQETLVILPLEDKLVIDERQRRGRIDTRVALVAFPGARPLGVYQVPGEAWPLPQDTHQDWWSPHNSRSPNYQLTRWIHELRQLQRGLPPDTMAVRPGETRFAGTPWLQGPGWRDRGKN